MARAVKEEAQVGAAMSERNVPLIMSDQVVTIELVEMKMCTRRIYQVWLQGLRWFGEYILVRKET